jgi:hypothetical protein
MGMMQHTLEPETKQGGVSPLLMNMLSTSISWLVNEEELNKAIEADLERINELSAMSDGELRRLGITRSQITAYVLQETADI